MLLGDTLILDDLDCANKYRQQVSTLVVNAFKGDVTRDDSTALQNCCDIDSNGCNSVPTLPTMLCHGWLFQVVNIANNASLRAMELNVSEEIFLQTTKLQLLIK